MMACELKKMMNIHFLLRKLVVSTSGRGFSSLSHTMLDILSLLVKKNKFNIHNLWRQSLGRRRKSFTRRGVEHLQPLTTDPNSPKVSSKETEGNAPIIGHYDTDMCHNLCGQPCPWSSRASFVFQGLAATRKMSNPAGHGVLLFFPPTFSSAFFCAHFDVCNHPDVEAY